MLLVGGVELVRVFCRIGEVRVGWGPRKLRLKLVLLGLQRVGRSLVELSNVEKLFEDGDLLTGLLVARHQVRTQQGDHLRVGHSLIVKWIDLVQQVLHVDCVLEHTHRPNEVSELVLVYYSVHVRVDLLVNRVEFVQKAFVLFQLEVKNYALEVRVEQSGSVGAHLLVVAGHFVARHPLRAGRLAGEGGLEIFRVAVNDVRNLLVQH